MKFSFSNSEQGLVFGANRGIGLGIVKALLKNTEVKVFATCRDLSKSVELQELNKAFKDRLVVKECDPASEESLKNLYKEQTKIDFIINSIGVLHTEKMAPERKIEDCSLDHMIEAFKVNALVTINIAKVFRTALKKKTPTLFSTVSAKVGSIDDNRIGGWYSYRASKAALNMVLKNIAIEFNRRASHTSVVAMHPGTTITDLSKPFIQKTNYQLHSIEDTGQNIIKVLDQTEVSETAHFLSWDGSTISW